DTRVVFVTDGERNPWPQRVRERRWRIAGDARGRWGALRRREARAALAALNVPSQHARFLGLPDQGLTSLLVAQTEHAVALIAAELADWGPTLILAPSCRD